MSVEGMWLAVTGSVDEPSAIENGLVVILESGRVFGGDSFTALTGNYTIENGKMSAALRSWRWNLSNVEVVNVFGMSGPFDYEVELQADLVSDKLLSGRAQVKGVPQLQIQFQLHKAADLPG